MSFNLNKPFEQEAEVLKVMGHPLRLKILSGLHNDPCNVKQIWESLRLPQATVSQHLAILKNKGIITGRRDGVEVYYSLTHPLAKKIVDAL